MYYECENPTCRFELYENEIICPLCDEAQYKRIPSGPFSKEIKIEIARAKMLRRKDKSLGICIYLILFVASFVIPMLLALRIPKPHLHRMRFSDRRTDQTMFLTFFYYSWILNFFLVGFPGSFSTSFYRRLKKLRVIPFGLLRFIYTNRYLDIIYFIVAYYIMMLLGSRWVEPGLVELLATVSAKSPNANVGFIYDIGLPMYHTMCISILIIYSVCSLFNINNYSFEIHCRKEDHKRRRYRPRVPYE